MWREKLIPATPQDYEKWIIQHLDNGGKITHTYDYNFPNDFFVATGGFEVPELYGTDSVHVIVPKYFEVTCSAPGHSSVFFMVDGSLSRNGWVPMYKDIQII